MRINAVTPTSYLVRTTNVAKTQENKLQNENNSLPNYEAILPLKNQILFKGLNKDEKDPVPVGFNRHWELEQLQAELGYRFSDEKLLNQAFIHHSVLDALNIAPTIKYDYRRLAYLGDNALKMALAQTIYSQKDDVDPSKMISIQQKLLSEENLVKHSKALGLDDYLLIDEDYLRGRTPKKPYADIYRAFVGAMTADTDYYDFEDVKKFVEKEFIDEVKQECSLITKSGIEQLKGYVVAKGFDPSKIRYQTVMKNDGYTARVYYDRKFLATSSERYKDQAENKAALSALSALENKFVKL